ncbi:MAG TPA: hypothetical protein VL125_04325 [Pelobium sp.]|nr:hypothetical protein [Pelobium sp.]
MKTLTKLSAKELEYYINVRRWKKELDFLEVEVAFIKLLEDEMERFGARRDKLMNVSSFQKLADLVVDKEQVLILLTTQLSDLEKLTEGVHTRQSGQLAINQAQLEYQFNDIVRQFRDIKGHFFKHIGQMIAGRRKLVH